MRILIGYSMRSGSTLLQHLFNQHSQIRAFSDLTSFPVLAGLGLGLPLRNVCVKPMDLFFLGADTRILDRFDKLVWLSRDPRDSYLSAIESRYAYLFWPKGRRERGIDVGLLDRWRRIYSHYFADPARWHLVRYEDLVEDPETQLTRLLDYVELPKEELIPFSKFLPIAGGDMKLRGQTGIHNKSIQRHLRKMRPDQRAIFARELGPMMEQLGYRP